MPIIETTHGKLECFEENGLIVGRGIRFAAPPTGQHRFRPPEAPGAWTGVRQARDFGPVAPQRLPQDETQTATKISEDCLFLNVWSSGTTGAPRPVMVWIHGGAFTEGAGSRPMFDGSTLARRGKAVVVTFNYRLGPFGFLYLEGLSGTGLGSAPNVGILDQIAALEWVRDNIGAFGGDPGNVTVFGESGGGLSVAVLLAMPRARGLFHHAICQSAAADSVFTAEEGSHVAELFLAELDVRPEDAGSLAELPTEALLSAAQSVFAKVFGAVGLPPFRPVVDGQVLPRLPLEAIRAGQAADVPLMAGTTLDETKLAGASIPHLLSLDHSALKKELKSRFARSDLAAEPVIDAYTRIRAARGQDTNPTDLFHAIETDRMLRVPTTQLLEAHAPHQPRTYSYLFTWTSPNPKLGSCHTLELPFIFGTHRLPAMDEFAGTGPDAEALANRMQDAWIAFSRSGDPNNTGLPDWPAYNSEDRTTMLLGKTCRAQNDPFGPERLYWQEALERSGV